MELLWKCHYCETMNGNGEIGRDAECNSCGCDWLIWQCPTCQTANAGDTEIETMCTSCGIVVYVDIDGGVHQEDYHILIGGKTPRTISNVEWISNQKLVADIETYLDQNKSG